MHARTGDSGAYLYYACSDRRRYGTCDAPLVRADALEKELLDWLAQCHPGDRMEQTAREMVKRGPTRAA